jgi:polysaccharide pyruvyl transferase WcaK-like protein
VRIVLFNCKYSENLGDGLLAESLEAALRSARPGTQVETADLAGREGYGHVSTPRRREAISILGALPPPFRRGAVRTLLARKLPHLASRWRDLLRGADLAVFGGGQIFQDGDLNFPLKVGTALTACAELDVPVAVHAVGVSAEWSSPGRALFHRLLATRCVRVSVRDTGSRAAWARHFRGTSLQEAAVVPDPALLWPAVAPEGSRAVGINVTDPGILRYHGGERVDPEASALMFAQTARLLRDSGRSVILFTNGASEDEAHLDRVMARLDGADVTRAPRPLVPADLVATQQRFAAVAAHRLHACILAYRLGLPSVGLGWDRKLESFFAETGRSAFFIPSNAVTPAEIAARVSAACVTRSESARRDKLIGAAQAGVTRLVESLEGTKRCLTVGA